MTTMRSSFLLSALLFLAALPGTSQQIRVVQGKDIVEVEAVANNILRVHVQPDGKLTPRTLVLDPSLLTQAPIHLDMKDGTIKTLTSPEMSVSVSDGPPVSLRVNDAQGRLLLTIEDLLSQARDGGVAMLHDEHEDLYGMRGLEMKDSGAGVFRTGGATIAASGQGDGGAPFFFTKRYGVVVDSDGGSFEPRDELLWFNHDSRPDVEFFVIVGKPLDVIAGLSRLTGKSPMPPKWTLGFLNSQWGSTETELTEVARTYQQKQIPISGFILDFDWKAWGEDNYGEWRWNSTSGAGSAYPDKFPHGASGEFAADMLRQGIHLTGILKPRILISRVDGQPTEASAYATAHNFWYPNEPREQDYFTHRVAGNIDFANPDARKWFWDHLVPSFHAGMAGWWSDEADFTSKMTFNNFEFMNMGRALYEGQRAISADRAWSINRAYYLGAARYSYAEWSGDISTGFQSMAYQRKRMVAALDLGVNHWSMDTGGFNGHPTAENYARWMEFAAFVPIYRVHGTLDEKRQPWVYGPVAEAAAKRAMRLRFDLMPYIYSNERAGTETGVGIVRPLFWIFPDDANASEDTRSWMFGDALLVSPIVEHAATSHTLYLPQGTWFDYAGGERLSGGRELRVVADAKTWQDIPIFVRDGSIVATQPSEEGNELSRKVPLELDVFPSAARQADFAVYDDDGRTYAYENGAYFKQKIAAVQQGTMTDLTIAPVEGSYQTTIPSYLLRVHRATAALTSNGSAMRKFSSEAAFHESDQAGWASAKDRFGPVTLVRLATGVAGAKATNLTLR